eukprot:CAMPEP_0201552142 /NCGR_PEP_ID=MMETSP0173_2-20130828/14520_1 /ASSEMBLY_ACC=CAM_ASM_000268 /TAXON_ID=218659 /ORGANISM="Vexillifera sp., Strain DIVA3 564/2" /LENGTH=218 /DNA_ID=CAMNT_0047962571 /DNA_START=44 /DNA_END=697 /DNA_ORIENTATION=+
MSDLFEQYEREYNREISSCQRKLNNLPALNPEQRRLVFQEIEKSIEQGDQYLMQMEREARSALSMRSRLEGRVRNYREEQSKLKRNLQRSRQQLNGRSTYGSAEENNNGFDDDYEVASMDQRARLLEGTHALDSQKDRIRGIYDIGVQNEDIGVEIMGDLHGQRETLIRANDKLEDVDDNMTHGRRIVLDMTRRLITNQILLIVVIILLLGAIGLIVW